MKDIRPILIQGAMEVEIKRLKELVQNLEKKIIDTYEFYIGDINGHQVVISKTDVGLINVGLSTMIGIKQFNPKFILNQGTAGGIGYKVHKGDIVIGINSLNTNSYKTGIMLEGEGSNSLNWEIQTFHDGEDKLEKIEASKELIEFVKENIDDMSEDIIYGTIGSGDCWNREIDRIKLFNEKYQVICADMETIGAYQVSNRYKVPILGIRVISDNELLKEEYERDIAVKVQEFVYDLCEKIINKE